jgi:3-oxoacyl-[acyl-carrier protein] reductase
VSGVQGASALSGRVAVITGGCSGIGRAVAELYAQHGARIAVNSRSPETAARTAAELIAGGYQAIPAPGDVGHRPGAEAIIDAAMRQWGAVDILVNSAGIGSIEDSVVLAAEEWRRVIDTNLSGPFFCAQAAAAAMIPRGRGVIINVGSILGHVALPGRAAYAAAKHGLLGLTKVLAVEWARLNIRVVCIDPGYIWTRNMEQRVAAGVYSTDDVRRRTPLGRFGRVEEVAQTALFLATDSAAYVTGSTIMLDGGWTAYGGW